MELKRDERIIGDQSTQWWNHNAAIDMIIECVEDSKRMDFALFHCPKPFDYRIQYSIVCNQFGYFFWEQIQRVNLVLCRQPECRKKGFITEFLWTGKLLAHPYRSVTRSFTDQENDGT